MKILKTKQVKEADEYTIKNEPISSIDLMERAASRASEWILENFEFQQDFDVFAGPGNNGGDGLVIARKLAEAGKKVRVFIVEFTNKFSKDFKENFNKIKHIDVFYIKKTEDFPKLKGNTVIIDAIFGSGLSRPVVGFAGEVIEQINRSDKLAIISIDIPSGLFGEENHHYPEQHIVKADFTLTFEFPFISFFLAENEDYVGEVIIIPIGISKDYIEKAETDFFLLEEDEVFELIKPRKTFSHKGHYGHGLLFAGGYGRMGAAVLAARAAHRAGIGLLTAHLPQKCVDIMQISSPETMLSIDSDKYIITKIKNTSKYNAFGIGPAIGLEAKTAEAMFKLFENHKNKPFVIDADAITLLGQKKKNFNKLPKHAILTPHPKEFERLVGKTQNHYQRLLEQRKFSVRYNVIIVLKGAYTSISLPNGKVYFNPTGNPGMATAGSGDVLTGFILGLLAQGYSAEDAAKLGVYLHGLAGDMAAEEVGVNSIIASDIADFLPYAMGYYE